MRCPTMALAWPRFAQYTDSHLLNREARVVQRHQRRLRAELRHGHVREAPELHHVDTEHVDVAHRELLEAWLRGWKK